MNLELPATDCLICQDLCEGDGQPISEKPLTCLTLHIQSCKDIIHIKCRGVYRYQTYKTSIDKIFAIIELSQFSQHVIITSSAYHSLNMRQSNAAIQTLI